MPFSLDLYLPINLPVSRMGHCSYWGKLGQVPEVLREGGRPKKLLTLVREAIRRRHMSGRTEESYVSWIKRYIARKVYRILVSPLYTSTAISVP